MTSVLSSERTKAVRSASVDVIRCGAAGDIFCLEMSAVANVKPASDCRSFRQVEPNDPVGFINHRGQDVPVFDLPDLLTLPDETRQPGHYVVIIDHPIQKYGLRVESVSRVIPLVPDHVLPLPRPLEHVGHCFRGIVDFTRDQKVPTEELASHHLPGITEPRPIRGNRRRAMHQMLLLLNPSSLLPGHEAKSGAAIPFQLLQKRYAAAAGVGQPGTGRQIVMFAAGVFADRQLMIGLSISQIVEISVPLTTISIPAVNPVISGLAQWRGCPVPVINLQASLQHEEPGGPVSHVLILRDHNSGGLLALPVSGRVQSQRLPIDHRPCPLPDKKWANYVLGVFELEERLLVLPRLDAISGLAVQPPA